jgi:hypothetical protein
LEGPGNAFGKAWKCIHEGLELITSRRVRNTFRRAWEIIWKDTEHTQKEPENTFRRGTLSYTRWSMCDSVIRFWSLVDQSRMRTCLDSWPGSPTLLRVSGIAAEAKMAGLCEVYDRNVSLMTLTSVNRGNLDSLHLLLSRVLDVCSFLEGELVFVDLCAMQSDDQDSDGLGSTKSR